MIESNNFTTAKAINTLVAFFGFNSVDETQSYLEANPETLNEYSEGIKKALKNYEKDGIPFLFPLLVNPEIKPEDKAEIEPEDKAEIEPVNKDKETDLNNKTKEDLLEILNQLDPENKLTDRNLKTEIVEAIEVLQS